MDEVEEFHDKMRQVGAHKGTIVTRLGFQSSAITYAKSHRIGLMVLQKEKMRVLALAQDAPSEEIHIVSSYALYTFGKEVEGPELGTLIEYELRNIGLSNRP